MSKSKNRQGFQAGRMPAISAMVLALSLGSAVTQTAVAAQEAAPRPPGELYVLLQAARSAGAGAEGTQVPQDIRIMQRIVSTALGEVAPPGLPDELKEAAGSPRSSIVFAYNVGGSEVRLSGLAGGGRTYSIVGRDVTGFYMQGYGYLFTVKWRVAPRGISFLSSETAAARVAELSGLAVVARRAAAAAGATEARAAGEAEMALQEERERIEERQAAWDQWSAQYRDMLAGALREVVALYGSTLKRATPEESITFIADFGGGDAETVTASVRRGQLTGASRDENLAAVRMATGETGVSGILRTELKIMAEIIDSSLQLEHPVNVLDYAAQVRYFGGDSSYQYVPGYGVLFRKGARLNLATQVLRQWAPDRIESGVTPQSLRQRMQESNEEQLRAYSEHLVDLKQKTAEILATYGPTLTEMNDDEWVGVYYDVGLAAGLLDGGITNFLVQARMEDIRQAGGEADGAAWLLARLVTNEKGGVNIRGGSIAVRFELTQ